MSSLDQLGGPVKRFANRDEWQAYREELADCLRAWEHRNSQSLAQNALTEGTWKKLNTRWEAHPDFTGVRLIDIIDTLDRQARQAIADYRLMSSLPLNTPPHEFARAEITLANLDVQWRWFGGKDHLHMTAAELQAHFRRCAKADASGWWQGDFKVLAGNRRNYELSRELHLRRPSYKAQDYSLNAYVRDAVEGAQFPKETYAALYLRKTRTPSSLLIVVAAIGYFADVPHAGLIAMIAVLYFVSTYLLYPLFVGERWAR